MSGDVHLELKGIAKRFGATQALSGAELTVRRGEAHALMGANGAGKSTLMNILGGLVARDAGEIRLAGEEVSIRSPGEARRLGISFVHQELNMLPSMSVAENILIDDLPRRRLWTDRGEMRRKAQALLDRLGCAFSPDDAVESLGMGDRQMVEIARALSSKPGIVILDEPTSSLSSREKARLFAVVNRLKQAGAAVIYITHFVEEIFEVCDRVTVMRNGGTVGAAQVASTTPAEVVRLMLGDVREGERLRGLDAALGERVLEVESLSRSGSLDQVGFSLRAGEIVGLWGLLGSGRTEIMRALIGLDPIDGGAIRFRSAAALEDVAPAELHAHVGFVTEDRRGEGLLLPLSIAQNISLANLDKVAGPLGLIRGGRERRFAAGLAERIRIKFASVDQPVRTLSGGNQQKVVFARWLGAAPRLFFLDEPTRGLDIGAKTDILKLTVALAEGGAAVLIACSELEELMRVCDRYLVVRRGRIVGGMPASSTKDALIAALSEGGAALEAA